MVLSKQTYSLKAVREALYWGEKNSTAIINEDPNSWIIDFKLESNEENIDSIEFNFLKRVNDFQLRHQINEETKNLRQLIYAKMLFPQHISVQTNDKNDDPLEQLEGK